MTYQELREFYATHFSLGNINEDISKKFALISLICYITYESKKTKPDVDVYRVITKVSDGMHLPEDFIKGLSVICEDFMYGCTKFPTFGLKNNEIVKQIRLILDSYMPF